MAKLSFKPIRKVYQATPWDIELFKKGRIDANNVLDHYMRSPTSGTRWSRIPADPEDAVKAKAWERIYDDYCRAAKPEEFFSWNGIKFDLLYDEDDYPIFWHRHGWLLQPWQLQAHHASQPEITIIGGFGTGKTAFIAASLCVCAMTLPDFRGYAVAPQKIQSNEVYRYIQTNFRNTPFYDRFVWRDVTSPYPILELKGSHLGNGSTIEILAVEDDPEKVRTLEGDVIFLDQAEKFDNLDEMTIDIGSRLRGTINGRNRMGRLCYVANAGNNPALWQRFDMGFLPDGDPTTYLSLSPSSRKDNAYLSERDIKNLYRRVGGTEAAAAQWLDGTRANGKGVWFPTEMVDKNVAPELDKYIEKNAARERTDNPGADPKTYQWWYEKNSEANVHHFEMPADHDGGRYYMVVGDPGSANPPLRNSGVVMAWDVTEFPKGRARLVGFQWVYGNGFYDPFLTAYTRMVKKYRAQGRNGFDATGVQKGFDELYFATHKIYARGMNMGGDGGSGSGKLFALNSAKFIMGAGKLELPDLIYIRNQLTNYDIPDKKIRQDITMTIAMSCQYMKDYFFIDIPEDEDELTGNELQPTVPDNRSGRSSKSRSSRSHR